MRRRAFIRLIGGVAAGGRSLRVHNRRAADHRIPRCEHFVGRTHWTGAFVRRLGELGWTEGRNLTIEYRWAEGSGERYVEVAAEFVRLKVDVIVTGGSAIPAAMQATSTPIVFALAVDPIVGGLVTSLARPGGNVTGCRPYRKIRPPSGSKSCVRAFLASVVWRCWETEAMPKAQRRCVRFRVRHDRSALKLTGSKLGARRTLRPPLIRSRAGRRRFMCALTRW